MERNRETRRREGFSLRTSRLRVFLFRRQCRSNVELNEVGPRQRRRRVSKDGAATIAVVPTQPSGDVIVLTPNVIAVRHWDRLLGGLLYAATPRVEWASLLRRSFSVDVLECPKCHGRLRVLAVITEREPVRRILGHLGMPTDAPPVARARDPTDDAEDVEPSGQLGLGIA